MVTPRSLYSCFYHLKEGEELIPLAGPIPEDEKERLARGFTYLSSSRGNKQWEEMFAEAITESDVLAIC
jgi:ubiquinone biosynthesis protein UbiJ